MRALVVFALIIASGFAAPVDNAEDFEDLQRANQFWNIDEIEELQRTKKSYGAPCGGASAYAPVALYLGPSPPHYRDTELEEDLKARTFYEGSVAGLSGGASYGGGDYAAPIPAALSGGYGGMSSGSGGYGASHGGFANLASGAAAHGPAIGVFPNAHVGGCNVPLLLSCAPNVISGHLAQTHSYGAPAPQAHSYGAAPAYRSFEEDMKKEAAWAEARKADWAQEKKAELTEKKMDWAQEKKLDSALEKKMDWAQEKKAETQERKASHHKVSEDYPEPPQPQPHQGSHFVVSHDYPQANLVHIQAHPVSEQPAKKN